MKGRFLALLLLLLAALPATVLAGSDPLLPDRPDTAPAYSQQVPLYDDPRFEPWDYTFEGQEWNRTDYATIYFWMNQLQVAKAWALKLAIRVVEYALHADLVRPLIAPAGALAEQLHQALWSAPGPSLVLGGLALAGLWALLLHLRGRVSRAWGALAGSVLILIAATLVMGNGERTVERLVTLSRGVAVELFDAASGGQDLIARGGDAAWRVLVYEPWLTGELSTLGRATYRTPDGIDGGSFLAMSTTQRHNICLYNVTQGQTYCPWWELDYLPRRMLLSLWTALAGFSVAGALTLLGGAIIVAQATLLLFLALAPVWLMAALWWPEQGFRLVRGVLLRGFGALVVQGMLAAALAAFLALTLALYTAFKASGWMMNSLVFTALAWLVVRYRYGWWQPLLVITERIQRRAEPVIIRHGEQRRAQGSRQPPALTEAAPAFAAIPESLVLPQSVRIIEQSRQTRTEGERIAGSPKESFESQMRQVEREITLRQETQHYRRILERTGELPDSGGDPSGPMPTPAAAQSGPSAAQSRRRPDLFRITPPRPKG